MNDIKNNSIQFQTNFTMIKNNTLFLTKAKGGPQISHQTKILKKVQIIHQTKIIKNKIIFQPMKIIKYLRKQNN